MKNGWHVRKLGDLCEIELGKTPARANKAFWDEKRETSNVWLSIADLLNAENNFVVDSKEYLSNKGAEISKIVRKGTLLASFKLTLGRLAFTGRDLFTNEAIAALTICNESELSKEFLFYFLRFFDWRKAAENDVKLKGMTLNKAKLKKMDVYFPSLPEQKRLVKVLDEVFEKTTKAKENAKNNLQNACELFESYLQNVFANPGDGWEEKKLMEICEIRPPKSEARSKLKDTDTVSFVPMEDLGIKQKRLIPTKERALKEVEGSYTYFANMDVLLAKITPCFENGKLGIASNLKNGVGFGSSEYIVLRANKDLIPEFLYYYLLRENFRQEGAKRMMGAVGHKRVSKEFIENSIIPFPGISEQKQIISKFDALSAETKKLEAIYQQKLADLEELKKSILQKAFNGELAGTCS